MLTNKKYFRNNLSGRIILVLLIGLIFFPLLPIVSRAIILCNVSPGSTVSQSLSLVQTVNGCIKAPLQLIATIFLMCIGSSHTYLWLIMAISFTELVISTMQANIHCFCGRQPGIYLYLVASHLPFFIHAIIFRAITAAVLFIYLDKLAFISFFLIWLSNIIIGYFTLQHYQIPKKLAKSISKLKQLSTKESESISYKTRVQSIGDIPVWLNSFLSIFVPTCYLSDLEPRIKETLTDEQTQELFQHQKRFQQKVLKHQIKTSTTILIISLGIVFYLVNFTRFSYKSNILNNYDFNILCCVIFILGIFSYLFIFGIDIFKSLRLKPTQNQNEEKNIKLDRSVKEFESQDSGIDMPDGVDCAVKIPYLSTTPSNCKLLLFSLVLTLLVISPVIIGLTYYTSLPPPTSVLLVVGKENNTWASKATLLNNPNQFSKLNIERSNLVLPLNLKMDRGSPGNGLTTATSNRICDENTVNVDALLRCRPKHIAVPSQVLVVDTDTEKCSKILDDVEALPNSKIECLPYSGIILLESGKRSSSKILQRNTNKLKMLPILSVFHNESVKFREMLTRKVTIKLP